MQLEAETGKTALFLELDLATLASVKKAADEFKKSARRIAEPTSELTTSLPQ